MKKMMIAIVALALLSCSQQKPFMAKWQMHQVLQNGKDVSSEHNPHQERWIEMKQDGSFTSGGRPYEENSGKWRLTKENWLHWDSDVGEEDDSYWSFELNGDTLILQGQKFDFAKQFKLKFLKIE